MSRASPPLPAAAPALADTALGGRQGEAETGATQQMSQGTEAIGLGRGGRGGHLDCEAPALGRRRSGCPCTFTRYTLRFHFQFQREQQSEPALPAQGTLAPGTLLTLTS